ncbi:hypothetical protein AgCh_007383 [Apium graveolens]
MSSQDVPQQAPPQDAVMKEVVHVDLEDGEVKGVDHADKEGGKSDRKGKKSSKAWDYFDEIKGCPGLRKENHFRSQQSKSPQRGAPLLLSNHGGPSAMASVSMTQQMPTQATKTTTSKSKAKKAPSSFSQKKPVAKTTNYKEGSVKESELGEGQGENQRNPKDKAGEISVPKPSHTTVSQQTVVINKEFSTTLVSSSQKDVTIETSSQPVAQAKRARDTSSPQTYLDVAPINMESQQKSLIIEAPETPNLPTHSLDVDMIHTSLPNSPSLTLLEKPKIQASEHHLLDDLLAHLPILSESTKTSVQNLKSITTDAMVVSTSNSFIPSISTDIVHPLVSDCIPMDVPNSSHPSASLTTIPTDVSHPSVLSAQLQIPTIVISADDLVVVQSLLGLRAVSELSERLGCSQAKEEERSEPMQTISSGLEKVSEGSPTLEGEGEGGEPRGALDAKTEKN